MKQQTPKLRDLLRTAPPRRAAPTSPPQLSPPESAHRPRPNRGTERGAPPAPRPRCPPRPREGSPRVAALPPPPGAAQPPPPPGSALAGAPLPAAPAPRPPPLSPGKRRRAPRGGGAAAAAGSGAGCGERSSVRSLPPSRPRTARRIPRPRRQTLLAADRSGAAPPGEARRGAERTGLGAEPRRPRPAAPRQTFSRHFSPNSAAAARWGGPAVPAPTGGPGRAGPGGGGGGKRSLSAPHSAPGDRGRRNGAGLGTCPPPRRGPAERGAEAGAVPRRRRTPTSTSLLALGVHSPRNALHGAAAAAARGCRQNPDRTGPPRAAPRREPRAPPAAPRARRPPAPHGASGSGRVTEPRPRGCRCDGCPGGCPCRVSPPRPPRGSLRMTAPLPFGRTVSQSRVPTSDSAARPPASSPLP